VRGRRTSFHGYFGRPDSRDATAFHPGRVVPQPVTIGPIPRSCGVSSTRTATFSIVGFGARRLIISGGVQGVPPRGVGRERSAEPPAVIGTVAVVAQRHPTNGAKGDGDRLRQRQPPDIALAELKMRRGSQTGNWLTCP